MMHPKVSEEYVSPFHSNIEVPITIRSKVCMWDCGEKCNHDIRKRLYPPRIGLPTCSYCNKPPFWSVYRCVSCDVFFILDFTDPKFCFAYPHCWDCLPKLQWAYCTDHTRGHSHCGWFPPVGLNPKKFTTNELDDFVKELGLSFTL